MSKKKSLGSSPIGYSSLGRDSFEFIPTINKKENSISSTACSLGSQDNFSNDSSTRSSGVSTPGDVVEKRIVSYYLEEHLVERLKRVADKRKMYYSTLVNHAIYLWLESRGYD